MELDEQKRQELMNRLKPGCICKGIKLWKIERAIKQGARTYKEVAARTGIGGGSCGGRRCGRKVKELLDRYKKTDDTCESP